MKKYSKIGHQSKGRIFKESLSKYRSLIKEIEIVLFTALHLED